MYQIECRLEKKFWAKAVSMACYLINRSPRAALDGKVAKEVWTGNEVDYSRLRVFGCPAYTHIAREERSKLDAKFRQCIFLGFQKEVKDFKLWDPKANKVVISRNVIFDEKVILKNTHKEEKQASKNHCNYEYVVQVELETHNAKDDTQNAERASTKYQQPYSTFTCRDKHTIKPPTKYGFEDLVSYALMTSSGDPINFQEAIHSQEKGSWMGAMEEEMQSLHKNQTWELVEIPKGKRAIGCKWAYKKKEVVSENEGEKFKAHLVVKGYPQKHGVDYDEIFSPVVKHTSIRIVLSLVAYFDMGSLNMDKNT